MDLFHLKKLIQQAIVCVALTVSGTCFAAGDGTLADRHINRGQKCDACHETMNKLKTYGDYGVCASCHGDYDAMIKRTQAKYANSPDPNPHDEHDGALPCTECHKGHTRGKNYCGECHSYTYKVP
ncbi:MAG: cytochrome c3 family protein [Sutterellaceae bacterium]|nr:cytochrome c3 family protein [Sutterellaceae bacterium]